LLPALHIINILSDVKTQASKKFHKKDTGLKEYIYHVGTEANTHTFGADWFFTIPEGRNSISSFKWQ